MAVVREQERGADRAWRVVAGASLCVFCGLPQVVMYTFGLFLPAVIAAEHWRPATIASAIGPGVITASLSSPLIGYAADRFGVRRMTLLGGPLFGLGLAGLGLLPQSAGGFVLGMVLMSALAFAGSPVPYAQALAGWFSARKGAAISIMFGCGALGISLWPQYAAWLIPALGWRRAYAVLGATAGTIITATALLMLRDPPRAAPTSDAGLAAAGLPAGQAVAIARFWKIAIAFMLLSAVLAGTAVSFPILMRERGADPALAATALSIIGVMTFVGRILLGLVLDRWFAPRLTMAVMLLPVAGLLILVGDHGPTGMLIAAGLVGIGLGSEFNAAAFIVSEAFGRRAFGTIYGFVTLIYGLGSAAGSALIATALVTQVQPAAVLAGATAILLLAIGVLGSIGRADLPFGGPPPAAADPGRPGLSHARGSRR